MRKCEGSACGLRFPVESGSDKGSACPICGARTRFVDDAFTTDQVTTARAPVGPRLEVMLDNVRSLRNVGAILRTADGVGLEHVHFGGFTPTSAHPKIAKTSLGAERNVSWTHHPDPLAACDSLLAAGKRLWALEGGPRSRDLFDVAERAGGPDAPSLVLVLGHEVSGVDPRILARCHEIVRIPMAGVKGSLNVSVAFGIAAYVLRYRASGVAPEPAAKV